MEQGRWRHRRRRRLHSRHHHRGLKDGNGPYTSLLFRKCLCRGLRRRRSVAHLCASTLSFCSLRSHQRESFTKAGSKLKDSPLFLRSCFSAFLPPMKKQPTIDMGLKADPRIWWILGTKLFGINHLSQLKHYWRIHIIMRRPWTLIRPVFETQSEKEGGLKDLQDNISNLDLFWASLGERGNNLAETLVCGHNDENYHFWVGGKTKAERRGRGDQERKRKWLVVGKAN